MLISFISVLNSYFSLSALISPWFKYEETIVTDGCIIHQGSSFGLWDEMCGKPLNNVEYEHEVRKWNVIRAFSLLTFIISGPVVVFLSFYTERANRTWMWKFLAIFNLLSLVTSVITWAVYLVDHVDEENSDVVNQIFAGCVSQMITTVGCSIVFSLNIKNYCKENSSPQGDYGTTIGGKDLEDSNDQDEVESPKKV